MCFLKTFFSVTFCFLFFGKKNFLLCQLFKKEKKIKKNSKRSEKIILKNIRENYRKNLGNIPNLTKLIVFSFKKSKGKVSNKIFLKEK